MAVLKRKIGLAALDILCINISILLAFLVRYEWSVPEAYSRRYWLIASAVVIIAIIVFYFFNIKSMIKVKNMVNNASYWDNLFQLII